MFMGANRQVSETSSSDNIECTAETQEKLCLKQEGIGGSTINIMFSPVLVL